MKNQPYPIPHELNPWWSGTKTAKTFSGFERALGTQIGANNKMKTDPTVGQDTSGKMFAEKRVIFNTWKSAFANTV